MLSSRLRRISMDLGKFQRYISRSSIERKKRLSKRDRRKYESIDLALKHFDQFYMQTYPTLWHSMRLALLSQSKSAALINNFWEPDEKLLDRIIDRSGAVDVLSAIRASFANQEFRDQFNIDQLTVSSEMDQSPERSSPLGEKQLLGESSRSNIDEFMPVTEVHSEHHVYHRMGEIHSVSDSVLRGLEALSWVPDEQIHLIPPNLRVLVLPRGSVLRLPKPVSDSGNILNYYPYDLGSALAVCALNVRKDDKVLDMCAAPGGKTLTMLQNLSLKYLEAVDNSASRISRLHHVLMAYCPSSLLKDGIVKVRCNDALRLNYSRRFDRVLVDPPCSADRHSVTSVDHNLFGRGRRPERRNLPRLQTALLRKAVSFCKPGGEVVYSTCTLSTAQNEGAVLTAIGHLANAGISVAAVDLRPLMAAAEPFCRIMERPIGHLVTPFLPENYGPTYICKLRRLS